MSPTKAPPRFMIVGDGTIRESRDEEDTHRPRKRQRNNNEDENDERRNRDVDSKESRNDRTVRICDSEYYFKNDPLADCYVHIGQTAFKVHRSLLTISPTLEARLASQPHGPMTLYGISADDFRAVLWALYCSETDRNSWAPTTEEDLIRLLDLINAAKPYEFYELHTWALRKLQDVFTPPGSIIPSTCSSFFFTRLVAIAFESQTTVPDLLHATTTIWTDRVRRKDMPSIPAILCSDKHRLLELRGIAYYTYLHCIQDSASSSSNGSTAIQLHVDPKLSNVQVIRLFGGHASLVGYWERRRARPRKLDRPEACTNDAHRNCMKVWEERWHATVGSRKVLALASSDVLAILTAMRELMGLDQEVLQSVGEKCRLVGIRSIEHDISDVTSTLHEHFAGCL